MFFPVVFSDKHKFQKTLFLKFVCYPRIPKGKTFFRFLWKPLDHEIQNARLGADFAKFQAFHPKPNRNGDICTFLFSAPKWGGGYLQKKILKNFTFFCCFVCPYMSIYVHIGAVNGPVFLQKICNFFDFFHKKNVVFTILGGVKNEFYRNFSKKYFCP